MDDQAGLITRLENEVPIKGLIFQVADTQSENRAAQNDLASLRIHLQALVQRYNPVNGFVIFH